MDEQIQVNIGADEIVGEVIKKALRYLVFKSQEQTVDLRYCEALDAIKILDEVNLTSHPELPFQNMGRKSVTFTVEELPESLYSVENKTPGEGSSHSFLYEKDEDDEDGIEITRL